MEEPEDRLGMTEEQWRIFQEHTHGFGEQDAYGTDISLIRENLRLTPTQRLEKLQRAAEFHQELAKARRAIKEPAEPRQEKLSLEQWERLAEELTEDIEPSQSPLSDFAISREGIYEGR